MGVTELLEGLQKDGRKSKAFYNAASKQYLLIEAAHNAKNGEPALVTFTTFIADGAAGAGQPDYSCEYVSTWNSAWDVAKPTIP